jgi:hypothetical protein
MANQITTGAVGGRPYGAMGFATVEGVSEPLRARLYLRHHTTNGRYPYFDDGGTPFNTSDDRERTRVGNDRRSLQIVPTLQWRRGPARLSALGVWQRGQAGLPASHTNDPPSREATGTHLSSLKFERDLHQLSGALPDTLRVGAGHHDDVRSRADGGDAVGSSTADRLAVFTRRVSAGAAWLRDVHEVRIDADAARTHVNQRSATSTALRRDAHGAHAGWGVSLGPAWRVETKSVWRRQSSIGDDQTRGDQLVRGGDRHRDHRGASAAALWRHANWSTYLQAAAQQRPPSLLEEFGDAAYVRGNPELENEKSRHWELGGRVSDASQSVRLGMAAFQDRTSERLIFAPSLAQSVRAINIGEADVRGIDVTVDGALGMTGAAWGVTRLWPEDRTIATATRQLPGIPEWQAVALLSQTVGGATLRWQSRYRGEFFRDALNDVLMPATVIHTASADYEWEASSAVGVQAGAVLDNVTDVKSVAISARGGAAQDGETAFGDVAGFPLPGRQWRLLGTVSYKL